MYRKPAPTAATTTMAMQAIMKLRIPLLPFLILGLGKIPALARPGAF